MKTTSTNPHPRSMLDVRRWTFDVPPLLALLLPLVTAGSASAAVRYVDLNSTDPKPPYTDWATAARVIQDAVDAAAAGDEIVVTNGTYATGGRAVHGTMTNRVAVDKPLTLRSVNGPELTIIKGYQVPGTTNGDGAIRCVFLTNDASLSGFTLTNGATRITGDWREQWGGGLRCESTNAAVSDCVLTGNSAWGGGGGTHGSTLYNCTLTGNAGGGAMDATLYNCMLTGNSAAWGGGAYRSTLNNCTLTGNTATYYEGGGAYGGGALSSTLNNCTLTANSALGRGGGAENCVLYNCVLTGNSAIKHEVDPYSGRGGGASGCALNNCTLTANSAQYGGGADESTLNNCIVYFNTAPGGENYFMCELDSCCTTPKPPEGIGNLAVDPQLASASHLSAGSPCRGAGSAAYTSGRDIDGEAWADLPAIGCDEYHAGAVTGPLSPTILATFTNVATAYPVRFTALTEGPTSASAWDFGDGVMATNRACATHSWTEPGDYSVVLRAYNDSHPEGVSATVVVHVVPQPVFYVALDSTNPVPPFASWGTAATKIQDALDVAALPFGVAGTPLVLVSNGVYATGGRAVGTETNRVTVDKPLTLQSLNGPQLTIIKGNQVPGTTNGDGAIRCVYFTSASGASLSGFTLTNGAAGAGGGVFCETPNVVISNCVLAKNYSSSHGGGAFGWWDSHCVLNNCTLTGNSSGYVGGGAVNCTLNDCTLSGNGAGYSGGGAAGATLNNCLLTGNIAHSGGGASYVQDFNRVLTVTLNDCTLICNRATAHPEFGGTAFGGGVNRGTLNNCTLVGNSAQVGGGTSGGTLTDCTLTGNAADEGGGAYGGTLNNCIVYFNTAPVDANCGGGTTLNYCCTAPDPGGVGNITNAPLFVDAANGNLRLQPNSTCINAGNNAYVMLDTDLDGNPRIVRRTVDIGAYEYQGPGSTISYAWLQRYNLPTDGSADAADADADGLNTWQEWRCQTDPTNALSVLRLLSATPVGTDVLVRWSSMEGVSYFLERSTNLGAMPPFTPLAMDILGPTGTNTFTDPNAAALPTVFYRVGVQE